MISKKDLKQKSISTTFLPVHRNEVYRLVCSRYYKPRFTRKLGTFKKGMAGLSHRTSDDWRGQSRWARREDSSLTLFTFLNGIYLRHIFFTTTIQGAKDSPDCRNERCTFERLLACSSVAPFLRSFTITVVKGAKGKQFFLRCFQRITHLFTAV